MITEIYIKGMFDGGIGSSAYVVVEGGEEVFRGAMSFGASFPVDGQQYPCDAVSCEILAAVCGLARCGGSELLNIYSDNGSVVKLLSRGGEQNGRKELLASYWRRAEGRDVLADGIPYCNEDRGNRWHQLCCRLAEEAKTKKYDK